MSLALMNWYHQDLFSILLTHCIACALNYILLSALSSISSQCLAKIPTKEQAC